MRGRYPSGPECVNHLHGSALAKRRLKVVLKTMRGEMRVQDACQELGIGHVRFRQLRAQAMQAALARLEARPGGRPPHRQTAAEQEVDRLREQLAEVQVDCRAAQVREEIALILPRVAQETARPEKKNAPAETAAGAATAAGGDAFEVEHMKHVHELVEQRSTAPDEQRRGPAGQQAERRLEQATRQRAVAVHEQAAAQGWTQAETATRLGILPRTLRDWLVDCRRLDLPVLPLGRPLARSSCAQRNAVIDVLKEQGPAVSLATLQNQFPACARAELDDLLHRYRDFYRVHHPRLLHVLHWRQPGAVWAMDFAQAPQPIDGVYPYLLAVRDLASGYQLVWQPVATMETEVVLTILRHLFGWHGAPVVLKMDNGSAFRADMTKNFLEAAGVIPLFSPPGLPSYNGAIEASIGSLKSRTEAYAAWHGRPGLWRWEDVSAALDQAYTTVRRSGHAPDQVWAARRPLSLITRVRFGLTVEARRLQARQEAGIALEEELDHWRASAVDRQAIRRALGEHGYLLFRRRRILLPVRGRKVTKVR